MDSIEDDAMLLSLTEQIDTKLFEWMSVHKVPPLNLTAVILARLTWLAKQGNYENDFISLLEAPSQILNDEPKEKQIH